MAEYIEREAIEYPYMTMSMWGINSATCKAYNEGVKAVEDYIASIPTADVVEVVRCKDCIHAEELDKHCDINRTAYKHCTLLRGDETKYVWHKYKKYYKDYSIVEPNDFCSYGIKRGEDND